jgi:DNA-binding NtrC family response regulator
MSSAEKTIPIRLLVVDDDEALLEMMQQRFERTGMKVFATTTGSEALNLAAHERIDIALLDINLPDANGLELLTKLKEQHPDIEVIMLTAHAGVDSALTAMRSGAYDYLTKPFHFTELEVHIEKAHEKVKLARRERQWVEHIGFESPRYKMVGSSAPHRRVMQMIEKVAPSDTTVLIRGASGTGKELVARALHYNSPRRNRPLVTVNCAALQETLLESELFGHEKGAFTGAVQTKPGLVEVAEGGTLFIDEIAEMGPGLQAKLLRVVENGAYRRVGSTREASADVRIVAATNKNLEEEQKNNRFREDLYYRLNVVTIMLPALKERREDIRELVAHLLHTRQIGPTPFTMTSEAMDALTQYDWPGNIRELANVLERAQILAEEHEITLDDLPENIVEARAATQSADGGPSDDPHFLREVERRHVLAMLRREKGNKVRAAKALGISRRALYRLIAKYRFSDEDCHRL